MPEINLWAVLVAAIASMVLGSIWFGPLFGKIFMEGVGMDKWDKSKQDAMKRGMWKMYVQQFICSLLVAYVLAHIIWGMNTAFGRPFDAMSGLSTGFWVWLGFFLPVMYGGHLWTGKAFKYAAIDIGYWLVLLSVMGMILASWQV